MSREREHAEALLPRGHPPPSCLVDTRRRAGTWGSSVGEEGHRAGCQRVLTRGRGLATRRQSRADSQTAGGPGRGIFGFLCLILSWKQRQGSGEGSRLSGPPAAQVTIQWVRVLLSCVSTVIVHLYTHSLRRQGSGGVTLKSHSVTSAFISKSKSHSQHRFRVQKGIDPTC